MKILFFTTGLTESGAERQLFFLAKGLICNGHEVVIASLVGGNLVKKMREDKIKVICFNESLKSMKLYELLSYLNFIKRIVEEEAPDVVHSFLSHTNIFLKIALFYTKTKAKIGISFRTPPLRLPLVVCLEYLGFWKVDFITTNSQVAAQQIKKLYGFFLKKVCVINNGLELSKVEELDQLKLRKEFPYKEIVITVAQYRKEKDYLSNISVAEKVISIMPQVHFLYVGEGRERKKIEEVISKSRVKNNIHVVGRRTDIKELLSISTVFFLPTLGESQSNALIEAMAMKLPIVTTDIEANKQTAPYSFFVPKKEVKSMSESILLLLENDNREAVEKNYAFFIKMYSLKKMVQSYQNLYEKLI